jgi:serine/threonine protein kinase
VTGTDKHQYYRWFLLVKGMADYRTGHFEAVDRLNKTFSLGRERLYHTTPALNGMVYLFLAMAHHRLGQTQRARQALEQASETIEQEYYTQFGTLVGTFEYMSREQAEMNAFGVDTRSDVYALGVLLYELLTGTTPLQRHRLREAAYADIVRLIKEEEPPPPSTRLSSSGAALTGISQQRGSAPEQLTKLVRGELDWIVMRCLEKDRTRRYETANGLARDVERYLHDEPVDACPPTAGYKLRKFARKHKAGLATAAVSRVRVEGSVSARRSGPAP